jgi:hypothetical protein
MLAHLDATQTDLDLKPNDTIPRPVSLAAHKAASAGSPLFLGLLKVSKLRSQP